MHTSTILNGFNLLSRLVMNKSCDMGKLTLPFPSIMYIQRYLAKIHKLNLALNLHHACMQDEKFYRLP